MLFLIFPLILISPADFITRCDLESKVLTNLWTISNTSTGPPSYFLATIQVPYTSVWYQMSEQVKEAFWSADQVYMETTMVDGSDGFDGDNNDNCVDLPSENLHSIF